MTSFRRTWLRPLRSSSSSSSGRAGSTAFTNLRPRLSSLFWPSPSYFRFILKLLHELMTSSMNSWRRNEDLLSNFFEAMGSFIKYIFRCLFCFNLLVSVSQPFSSHRTFGTKSIIWQYLIFQIGTIYSISKKPSKELVELGKENTVLSNHARVIFFVYR